MAKSRDSRLETTQELLMLTFGNSLPFLISAIFFSMCSTLLP